MRKLVMSLAVMGSAIIAGVGGVPASAAPFSALNIAQGYAAVETGAVTSAGYRDRNWRRADRRPCRASRACSRPYFGYYPLYRPYYDYPPYNQPYYDYYPYYRPYYGVFGLEVPDFFSTGVGEERRPSALRSRSH